MQNLSSLLAIVSLVMMVSCGSTLTRRASTSPDDSGVAEGNIRVDSEYGCQIEELTEEEVSQGMVSYDINSLFVLDKEGEKKSLCQVVADEEFDAVVMQFSGATCSGCVDEAEYFSENLKKTTGEGKKIGHVVLFTDREGDYEEYFFADFMKISAPKSTRVHDIEADLWGKFSRVPGTFSRPTILSFNTNGKSFLINEEEADYHPMVEYVEALAAISGKQPVFESEQSDEGDLAGSGSEGEDPQEEDPQEETPEPEVDPIDITPPAGLGLEENVGLIDQDGFTTDFVSLMGQDTEYLVIDISQTNCGPCVSLANSHNSDSDYQNLFSTGKCKAVTLVASSQLSEWKSNFSQSSFTSQNSYGTISNIWGVGDRFGLDIRSTPTVFMIDREGDVISSRSGATPSEAYDLCR